MNIKIDIYLVISLAVLAFFKQIESFLIFYIFVVLHECIHILVAVILRIKVLEISFLPFGVNAKFNFENKKVREIIVASAGPIFSLFLAFLLREYAIENFFIFITNILPIYPLDGGRILKNLIILMIGMKNGIRIYNNLLRIFIILLLMLNIVLIIYLKSYRFIFVSLYIFQIASDELKKDKIRSQISTLLNIEI